MTTTSLTHSISRPHAGYWRATFGNPPINLVNPETILELQELVGLIESDKDLRVVVLDSAHPDFFFGRYDATVNGRRILWKWTTLCDSGRRHLRRIGE